MSWWKNPRFLAFAAIVIASSTALDRAWSQAPVVTPDQLEVDDGPFEDNLDDESLLAEESDYTCGCNDLSCLGDCSTGGSRTWVTADYLQWWTKGNRIPALVTSSPNGTLQTSAGILGAAGTQTLFGGDKIANEERSGLRINFGTWLDDCQQTGIEGNYFSVFNEGSTNSFFGQTTGGAGSGTPILARPFFDVNANTENARLASFVGIADGSITVASSSELHSAGVLLRQHMRSGSRGRIDLVGGYRFFRFREGLRIDENFVSTAAGGGIAMGTAIDVYDSFETENDFHGGEFGLAANFDGDRWGLELLGKFAIGNIHRTVNINGQTTVTTPPPGATTNTATGGLLALSSNIGQTTENDLAILPEFGANLTFDLNDRIQLRAGYTALALNNVARTGAQIDRSINTNLIPGGSGAGAAMPSRPRYSLSRFWAQGVNFGITGEF